MSDSTAYKITVSGEDEAAFWDLFFGGSQHETGRGIADEHEYNGLLFKKIAEEFKEAEAGGVISGLGRGGKALLEELADLTEVIQAMVKFRGWTVADLEHMRKQKRRQNGGFEKRLVLESWWKK